MPTQVVLATGNGWVTVEFGTTLQDSFSLLELGTISNQDPSLFEMFGWNPVNDCMNIQK